MINIFFLIFFSITWLLLNNKPYLEVFVLFGELFLGHIAIVLTLNVLFYLTEFYDFSHAVKTQIYVC